MKINDCILMKGSTENEPMTLYYITDMYDDKIRALSICICDEMVQGLEYASEYDNEIPKDAILLPTDSYSQVKEEMNTFLKEVKSFIKNNLISGPYELQVGGHYYGRFINTITEIGKERTKYNVFRLDPENISPIWTGSERTESFKDKCVPISDETYNKVLSMYKSLLVRLRNKFK